MIFAIAVALYILIWPVNRMAMRRGARTVATGAVISLVGMVLALIFAVIYKNPVFNAAALLSGLVTGVCYSVGFCIIVFYCLKIGPAGPTVTLNNLGCVGPIIMSIFVMRTALPSGFDIAGIICTFSALVLMALNRQKGGDDKSASLKWLLLALAGWAFSTVSLSSQFTATYYAPEAPFTYSFAVFGSSFLILLTVMLIRKERFPTRTELLAGGVSGVINIVATPMTFYLVTKFPAFMVFPALLTAPIVFMLIAGHFVFKERLNIFGWLASFSGLAGIILMNI